MNGIIGRKIGMTQVFDASGAQRNVTVIEAGPCSVVQRKTTDRDGYEAVQLGFDDQKPQRITKPLAGHFKKAGVDPKRLLREFEVEASSEAKAGDVITVSIFDGVGYVDVIATTKGRGFQGVMRRFGFGGGRATHGSGFHRRPGSIGMKEDPARVFKGKKMPGQMGNTQVTTQNLKVVQVRGEDNAILVEGAVPGPMGGWVIVRKAIKKSASKS